MKYDLPIQEVYQLNRRMKAAITEIYRIAQEGIHEGYRLYAQERAKVAQLEAKLRSLGVEP